MAGKTNYKAMTLEQLEEAAANLAAQSKRPTTALKNALRAARADAMHEANEATAPAPEPEQDGQADADAQDADEAATDAIAEANGYYEDRDETGRVERAEGLADADAQDAEGEAQPDHAPEHASQMVADQDDDAGYHEACELEHPEQVAQAAAERQARRKQFTKEVAKLMDGGFTDAQAVEALAEEYPDEAAEYKAIGDPTPTQPPARDPLDVDMATGEVRVDRPATQPVPPVGSFARVEATPYPVTFYRPVLKIISPDPDDPTKEIVEELTCPHVEKYGHGSEKAAISCARSMAYQRGLRIA